MKNVTKGKIIKAAAVVLDVGAPLIATLTQFPIWVNKSAEATMSGMFLLFALICAIPFFKQIKAYMKSPAVPVMWWVMFGIFVILSNIVNQIVLICFVGGVANTLGAGAYKLGQFVGERPDKEKHYDNNEEGVT